MTVLKIHQVPNSSYSPPSFEHKPEGFNTDGGMNIILIWSGLAFGKEN